MWECFTAGIYIKIGNIFQAHLNIVKGLTHRELNGVIQLMDRFPKMEYFTARQVAINSSVEQNMP